MAEVAFMGHPEFLQDGCGGGVSGIAGGVDAVHAELVKADVQELSADGGAQAAAPEAGMCEVLDFPLGMLEAADAELPHSYDLVVMEG
ncbi:hypothetical protein [Nonomuraea sp. B19D2]|uniref:hypothetical protein n=1 Tax=Nonomuraea sp. B19D2 TaxID=3159561 RepID=UPI0032DBBC7A